MTTHPDPLAALGRDDRESFEAFIIKHFGVDALCGGRMSIYDAVKKAWLNTRSEDRAALLAMAEVVEKMYNRIYWIADDRPLKIPELTEARIIVEAAKRLRGEAK